MGGWGRVSTGTSFFPLQALSVSKMYLYASFHNTQFQSSFTENHNV